VEQLGEAEIFERLWSLTSILNHICVEIQMATKFSPVSEWKAFHWNSVIMYLSEN